MGHGLDIFTRDRFSILVAKQVFQQDFQREGQSTDISDPFHPGGKTKVVHFPPLNFQSGANPETIQTLSGHNKVSGKNNTAVIRQLQPVSI
jgi:hypothetical protein